MSVEDAKRLKAANQSAKMTIIEGMNHIFKNADSDKTKNIQTYNQPELPVNAELVDVICSFILSK